MTEIIADHLIAYETSWTCWNAVRNLGLLVDTKEHTCYEGEVETFTDSIPENVKDVVTSW